MAWFRCPCGYMAEMEPAAGGEIVSAYHLHVAEARLGGGARLVRMEPLPDPVPEPALAVAGPLPR